MAAQANTSVVVTQVVVAAAAAALLPQQAAALCSSGPLLSSSRGSDLARQAKGIAPVAVAACPSATLRWVQPCQQQGCPQSHVLTRAETLRRIFWCMRVYRESDDGCWAFALSFPGASLSLSLVRNWQWVCLCDVVKDLAVRYLWFSATDVCNQLVATEHNWFNPAAGCFFLMLCHLYGRVATCDARGLLQAL